MCELAGVEPPRDRELDGTSLVPLLTGQSFERKKPLYWDYFNALGGPKAVMHVGDFTLLANRESPEVETTDGRGNVSPETMPIITSETLGGFELYDVKKDIGQKHDLAGSKADFVAKHAPELVKKHREVREEGPTWKFEKAK